MINLILNYCLGTEFFLYNVKKFEIKKMLQLNFCLEFSIYDFGGFIN